MIDLFIHDEFPHACEQNNYAKFASKSEFQFLINENKNPDPSDPIINSMHDLNSIRRRTD